MAIVATPFIQEGLPGMPPEPPERYLSDSLLRGYVIKEAADRGLLVLSLTYPLVRGQPGWPDLLVFSGGGHVLPAEMKQHGGRLSYSQQERAHQLRSLGFAYTVWRPGDWISRRIHRELDVLAGGPDRGQEAA